MPLVPNLRCTIGTVQVAGRHLPVTFADRADVPNCYLCCPTVAYRDYGIEETRHFARHAVLRTVLTGVLRAAGPVLRRSGLDHQCQVNNWILATNPPLGLTPDEAAALMLTLANRHPDRAIVARSLNDRADAPLLAALAQAGAVLLPARQVWIVGPDAPWALNRRRDARLLAQTTLAVVDGGSFADADFDEAARLYAMLYLQKYTPLNPQYSAAFLKGMHDAGIMRLIGLRQADGQLVAVVGTVALQDLLTAPVVGYRTDLPQKLGLYRMLIALAMAEAHARHLSFNISAGAAGFKRSRGAMPAIEYTAAYVAHLPLPSRLATAALSGLLNGIGVPIMKRFAL